MCGNNEQLMGYLVNREGYFYELYLCTWFYVIVFKLQFYRLVMNESHRWKMGENNLVREQIKNFLYLARR